MAARDCDGVTDAEADAIAAEALPKARTKPVLNPLLFMLTTIGTERDPWGRWLSGRPKPIRRAEASDPEWCRKCEEHDRTIDTGHGILKCPDCHPAVVGRNAVAPWEAAAS